MNLKLFDFQCEKCQTQEERCIYHHEIPLQKCKVCGTILRRLWTAKPEKAFTPHFNNALGVYLNDRKDERNALAEQRKRCEI